MNLWCVFFAARMPGSTSSKSPRPFLIVVPSIQIFNDHFFMSS